MIVDSIKNSKLYLNSIKGMEESITFIENFTEDKFPDGMYKIDGDQIYALVQSYETQEQSGIEWESHKEYIDLQYILNGKEIIYWSNITNLTMKSDYDRNDDCLYYLNQEGSSIKLSTGYFSILFPEDGHKPGCLWGKKTNVKKILIKIKIK